MVRKIFEIFCPFLETLGQLDFPKSAQNTPRVGQLPKKFYVTTIPISQGNFWAKVQNAGSWFKFQPILAIICLKSQLYFFDFNNTFCQI